MGQTSTRRRAAVIGGGTMGTDIAAIFTSGGWQVEVMEPDESRWGQALARVKSSHEQLGGSGEPSAIFVSTLGRISWGDLGIVVECVPEKLELKQRVFAELEKLAPRDLMLASNSSSFPISDIARGLVTGNRMLGLHFFMPAHLVPAVEVVKGEATNQAVCEQCAALMRELGKVPVMVKKDVPGFLANRLQHALAREAFAMIDEGLASAEDVDAAVRYGFGLRYLAAGPVLQKDIAGLDIHCAAARTMYPSLANNSAPSKVLTDKVDQGKLGMKTGEGFYSWTAESAATEKARYERALLEALKVLKSA
jgi:3-hydroxybutyryl-CoA dehydrogenase